ncbi:hypothetical protein LSH36_1428g00021, partial [Paralvinella palmiformis]
ISDVERNGKFLKNECFNGSCFQVKQFPWSFNDHDCCCPTISVYYRPLRFIENGITWIPFYPQWTRKGTCLSLNKVCWWSWPFHYHRCQQLKQWRMFVYFRRPFYFPLKYKYFLLPDYCYCPGHY